MSFRQRFTTKYKAGDLIYGLGDKITLLANQLIPGFKFKTSKEKLVELIRISEYCTADAEFDLFVESDVRKVYAKTFFFKKRKIAEKVEKIRELNKGFKDSLSNHPKYSDYLNMTQAQRLNPGNPFGNELWRRKSKGGLHYACFDSKHAITIHYCLDGIHLDQVINKSVPSLDFPETTVTKKQRGVTGSEIRWIYRNRYISSVSERIQFWKRGGSGKYVPCTPPWEWPIAEGGDWSQYKPTNAAPGADQP